MIFYKGLTEDLFVNPATIQYNKKLFKQTSSYINMTEKETIFSSNIKYTGVFPFSSLYKFCYEWLTEETGLDISENKYSEKLSGDSKNIEVEWTGTAEVTDYFKFQVKVSFTITGLKNVETPQGNKKIKTNQGQVKITTKGILLRDYKGKFETSALQKFMRSIYEKWVIPSRIEQFEEKLAQDCDEFLNQAKAYLDLEGKK